MKRHLLLAPMAMAAVVVCTPSLHAEQVFNEDVIVDGGLCAGDACASGNAFPNGVIAKSGLPSFTLIDTGVSTNRQWSVSTLQSDFVINDFTGASITSSALVIENGLEENRLYIDTDGEVGFGTSMPQRDLHVIDGVNATLRLEQDTSGGFQAHTWDMSVGNTGFQIIDVASPFSLFPMTIENGVPTASLYLANDGNVGSGTSSPSAAFHVARTNGTARIFVEETGGSGAQELFKMSSNGGSYFTLTNTTSGRDWFFTHENNVAGRFIITSSTNPSDGLFLAPNGNMTIGGTLTTGGGTCGGGCDRVFTEDYDLPSIAEHAEAMWSLGHLPNVGPTVENAPINVSDKLGRMLNELEHAHIYIAQLEARDRARQQEMAALTARLEALEATRAKP